jgi:hypothetical protein
MFIMQGKLRRKADFERKEGGGKLVKLWIEHEITREGAEGDLKLEEVFVSPEVGNPLSEGKETFLDVRPYPSGRDIRVSVARASQNIRDLLNPPATSPSNG